MTKIVATILLSMIAGVSYRMGGSGNFPRWVREVGGVLSMVSLMFVLGMFHWSLVICAGFMYGLMTTYFKKKGTDAVWWNWALVGLAFGLSMIPYCIFQGHWLGFGIRCVVCTVLTTLWSQLIGKAVLEEFGRGFINIATLPLLLIG